MINMSKDCPEYFNESQFIKKNNIIYRHYQNNIVEKCKNKNSLIVLPTGLGKTVIGILLIANALEKYKGLGKIIILAPTRPLVSQHKASCEKFLNIESNKIVSLTGKTPPIKRSMAFLNSRIIISTPQVIKNDILRGRYDLSHVSLVIFDEAHRARGNYAYTAISKEYIKNCSDPIIIALTASPGKDFKTIQKLCDDLLIEEIVFKTREDEDVKSYVHQIDTFLEKVELPVKMIEINEIWNHLFERFLLFFKKGKLINPYKKFFSKLDFLRICHDLTLSLKEYKYQDSTILDENITAQLFYQTPRIIDIVKEHTLDVQTIFSYCSSCISLLHGKDLLQTQDLSIFKSFLERIKYKADQDVSSAKRIVNSENFKFVSSLFEKEEYTNVLHPKIEKIFSIIKEENNLFHNKKIIIFSQYREMAELLKIRLYHQLKNNYIVEKFIGQMTRQEDFGYSQNKQIEILDDFRKNKIDILIATCVAEEGLDIPNVDAIIFYEPIPSEIRLIQRRGRTGRFSPGRCYVLMTKDTVDIPFYKIASSKEENMNVLLTESDQLTLHKDINRTAINFKNQQLNLDKLNCINYFEEKTRNDRELLANRSIEEIITEIDNFSNSLDYNKMKEFGVTFYSDIMKFNKIELKNSILKIKGNNPHQRSKKRPYYLNKNTRLLINIAKNSDNGKIKFSEFQAIAYQEDITDRKFHIHFNHACSAGYLQKKGDFVQLIKDYE
jgi:Fanconi anemia group M protein